MFGWISDLDGLFGDGPDSDSPEALLRSFCPASVSMERFEERAGGLVLCLYEIVKAQQHTDSFLWRGDIRGSARGIPTLEIYIIVRSPEYEELGSAIRSIVEKKEAVYLRDEQGVEYHHTFPESDETTLNTGREDFLSLQDRVASYFDVLDAEPENELDLDEENHAEPPEASPDHWLVDPTFWLSYYEEMQASNYRTPNWYIDSWDNTIKDKHKDDIKLRAGVEPDELEGVPSGVNISDRSIHHLRFSEDVQPLVKDKTAEEFFTSFESAVIDYLNLYAEMEKQLESVSF